jgi:Zn-dependent protease with chaperone function
VTNQIKTILLLGVLSAVLVAFGGMLGPGYLYFFTALAAVVNLGAYFFSDRIVLAMQRARELTPEHAPRLHALVGEIAVGAGIPKPRVFVVVEDDHANAFATGRSPSRGVVAVTTGLLGLSRSREYLADDAGAQISGDPEALAGALVKLARAAPSRSRVRPSRRPQACSSSTRWPAPGAFWGCSRRTRRWRSACGGFVPWRAGPGGRPKAATAADTSERR